MLAMIKIYKTRAIIDKSAPNVWKSSLGGVAVAAAGNMFTIANP